MTKKIVSLVSLVSSAGAVAFTAIPANAMTRLARFENSQEVLGLTAFALVTLAASAVATRLAFSKKVN
jgi:hypothetical protein